MAMTVADLLAQTLASAGVKRIWGVTGDSLNGLNDSLRRFDQIEWMHVRHEETAAFAAGAEAAATGLIARLLRRRCRVLDDGPTLQAALKAGHVALMLLVGLILISALILALSSVFGWTLDLSGARGQVIAANLLLAMVVMVELARAALTLALMPRR